MLFIYCVGLVIAVNGAHAAGCSNSWISSNPRNSSISCGPNSHYEQCGSKCPVTCSDILGASAPVCEVGCQPGCQCDVGFYKSNTGRCVTRDQCVVEQSCGPNSLYVLCGTDCPLTCDNYQNPPEVCDTRCVSGCQCIDGYVKASNGRCVKPEECYIANSCGPHSHYDGCVTACPRSCENYGKPIVACNAGCGPGCKCDDGYIIGPNGNCIAPRQCPSCGPNAHYESCGTDCPLTCDNYNNPPQVCTARCNPGCQCNKGFVKAPNGRCIRPKRCPKKGMVSQAQITCGPNEYYSNCVSPCNNCSQKGNCYYNCYSGCDCYRGYYRNANNQCVPEQQCPPTCGPNSHIDSCVTACPLTCENYQNPPEVCNAGCGEGCKCNDGYVLTKDGRCVAPNQCPVTCGTNEYYSNCVNPCNDCSQKGNCYYDCYSGCDCYTGYYRNADRQCVPGQQCPAAVVMN